jgi:menaquinone-dependent protoporphyrinogen IX oxidase
MKIIILYRSKTGFTKRYAEWIASELQCDLYDGAHFKWAGLSVYDIIIFGGGLYAGGINGVKELLRHAELPGRQKIIVFASGATPDRDETTEELRCRNFSAQQQKRIRFFYLRGGFDYSKLGVVDKFLMILLKMKLRSKPESRRSPDEKGMLAAYEGPADFTRRRNIDELVDHVRGLTKNNSDEIESNT